MCRCFHRRHRCCTKFCRCVALSLSGLQGVYSALSPHCSSLSLHSRMCARPSACLPASDSIHTHFFRFCRLAGYQCNDKHNTGLRRVICCRFTNMNYNNKHKTGLNERGIKSVLDVAAQDPRQQAGSPPPPCVCVCVCV